MLNPRPTDPSRRAFVAGVAGSAVAGTQAMLGAQAGRADERGKEARQFRVWAMSCSHVGTDRRRGRESLAEAIRQTEGTAESGAPKMEWDIALHLGDLSGSQGAPDDEEGREVVRQFGALKQHRREHFYNLAGNHDASGPREEAQWWFRKWIDPVGEQTEFSGVDPRRRPWPVTGTWERYSVRIGNLLILMLSDRNDGGPPVGRGERGGYPAGAVSGETFAWWQQQVEANRDAVIITCHHHMLKETTVASGPYEGLRRTPAGKWMSHYHGYFPQGGPEGASYLYFVDRKPDAQAFEKYLEGHPAAIDFWLGGHTHTHPDDNHGGRTHVERRWDVNFVNASALTRYHGRTCMPMSRRLTFTEGSDQVLVECYLHTSQHAPVGWYAKAAKTVPLRRAFQPG